MNALLVCGLLVGPMYVLLYILGGVLRPGYSHVSDSVSELLSPGAPNRRLLVVIQVAYALLHVLFGLGVVWVVGEYAQGTSATAPGQIHKVLVFGVLVPGAILSTVSLGLWSSQADVLSGFDVYSYVTAGLIVVMGGLGGATVKTRFAGLSERVAAVVTHQWLFVLALLLLSH